MTILITLDNNKNSTQWILTNDKLKYLEVFNDIKILDETILLDNINQDDFYIIYNLLKLKDIDILKDIEIYDTITLYNIYKITDYLIIKYLQEIIGTVIASRFNKMGIDELKINVDKLF